MNFIAITLACFTSSRLPSKPLADVNGKPTVVRVMERAQSFGADWVIVVTDHVSVVEAVKQTSSEVCLTRTDYKSSTEQI